jgi:phosphodiesterase/alkaline phosphatase D-like protein
MKTTFSFSLFLFLLTYSIFQQGCSQPKNEVINFWSGAIQPHSISVTAQLVASAKHVRLVVSEDSNFVKTLAGPADSTAAENKNIALLHIDGLQSYRKYYFAIESDGKLDTSAEDIGTFYTPADSPFSFNVTVGSCLASESHHPVFQRMLEKNPLLFLQTGDFHYDNPNSSNINRHRLPYERLLRNSTFRKFFHRCPIAYVWDDHDYCGNNSDSTATGKSNARIAYREYIPHYPFGSLIEGNDAPIFQSLTIGRIHFILTDLRSCRKFPTMLGAEQKAWFKNECINARNNKQVIAWVSTVSYGGKLEDNWGGFPSERTELANFFRDRSITNMFILSGDAHMVAIDNGSHHDFSTGHNNPNKYPVLQAAALNQSGSFKGGTFSGGYFPNPDRSYGQYGLVQVVDKGDSLIQIKLSGYRVNKEGKEVLLTSYSFTRKLQ